MASQVNSMKHILFYETHKNKKNTISTHSSRNWKIREPLPTHSEARQKQQQKTANSLINKDTETLGKCQQSSP